MSTPLHARLTAAALLIAAAALPHAALAGGGHSGGHSASLGPDIGKPADPAAATRTIKVVMTDNSFKFDAIDAKPGETVRFLVSNEGEFVHEFSIGTAMMHEKHEEEMVRMMESGQLTADHVMRSDMSHGHGRTGMAGHEDASSVLLEPGESGEIAWTFPAGAEDGLEFSCNVPGHRSDGMMGRFRMMQHET